MLFWIWGTTALLFAIVQFTGFIEDRRHAVDELQEEGLLLVRLHSAQLEAEIERAELVVADATGDPKRLAALLGKHPELTAVAVWRGSAGIEARRTPQDTVTVGPATGAPPPGPGLELGDALVMRVIVATAEGLATAERPLPKLLAPLRESRGDATYTFLAGPGGELLVLPASGALKLQKAGPELQKLVEQEVPRLGQFVDPVFGKPAWVAYARGPEQGWGVGLVYLMEEQIGVLYSLEVKAGLVAAAGLLLLLVLIWVLSNSISRPIADLSDSIRHLAEGELRRTIQPPPHATLEVKDLAQSFNLMVWDLRAYVERLQKTKAEQERLASELEIAASIQRSILPLALPERPECLLRAVTQPARELGGDFYDFFWVDSERLGFVLGDVSGKGVPAAIYMASCSSMLRTVALTGLSPAECVNQINRHLCDRNEPSMFVTLVYGVLELSLGRVSYVNCGHLPPLLLRRGTPTLLDAQAGLPLGVLPGSYEEMVLELQSGDRVLLYSDGVTETMNPDRGEFGEESLLQIVGGLAAADAQGVLDGILQGLQEFARGQPPWDDTTLLLLEYRG